MRHATQGAVSTFFFYRFLFRHSRRYLWALLRLLVIDVSCDMRRAAKNVYPTRRVIARGLMLLRDDTIQRPQ